MLQNSHKVTNLSNVTHVKKQAIVVSIASNSVVMLKLHLWNVNAVINEIAREQNEPEQEINMCMRWCTESM